MENLEQLTNFIKKAFPKAQHVQCSGDLYHVTILIVDNEFEALRMLKRHKHVYPVLKPLLDSKALHAITLKTYTPQEASLTELPQ